MVRLQGSTPAPSFLHCTSGSCDGEVKSNLIIQTEAKDSETKKFATGPALSQGWLGYLRDFSPVINGKRKDS